MSLNDAIIQENFRARPADQSSQDFEVAAEDYVEERAETFASDVVDGEFEALETKRKPISRYLLIGLGLLGVVGAGGAAYVLPDLLGQKEEINFAALAGQDHPVTVPVVENLSPVNLSQPDQITIGPDGVAVQSAPPEVKVEAPEVMLTNVAAPTTGDKPLISASAPTQVAAVSVPVIESAKAVATSPAAPNQKIAVKEAPAPKAVLAPPPASPVKKVVESEKKAPEDAKRPPATPPKARATDATVIGDKTVVNDVKPLITVTANQIGLRSLLRDGLVVSVSGELRRFVVGDYLPSGDRVVFIDSQASTIVTDKQIIRVVN